MAKSKILREALADVQEVKKAAIQNAKNLLAESIHPKIQEFIDSQIGESDFTLEAGGEGAEEDELETPEIEEEGMYEMPVEVAEKEDDEGEEEEEMDLEQALRGLGEADEKEEDEDDEEEVEEVVEYTNEDLKRALSEILQDTMTEATVTKSFGDVQDPTPKTAGGKQQTGIADEKSGEHQWVDETPPDSEDWTVKESRYRKAIMALKEQVGVYKQYKEGYSFLRKEMKELNLFNNRLLYTNNILQNTNLSNKQRKAVVEMFDAAKSIREVELTYKTLSEGLKIAGVVSESKKNFKKGRSSTFTTSSSGKILKESLQRGEEDSQSARWELLAGIGK